MWTIRRVAMPLFVGAALFLVPGCAAERPPEVPQSALNKSEGNKQLVYTADDNGMIWVTDHGNNSIVYSGPVHRGDHIVLDPDANQITLNDQVVFNRGLNHDDHSIYFQPGAAPAVQAKVDVSIARPPQVPTTAQLEAEGSDRLEYTANADGAFWVADGDANTLLYSSRCMRGDNLVVDPANNKLTLNGNSVYTQNVPRKDLRIFFLAGGEAAPLAGPTPATLTLHASDLPPTAVVRTETTGRSQVVADNDGTVWVVDSATHRLIYTGRMLHGDTLTVDPDSQRLLLNNHPTATTGDLPTGRYRVYFAPMDSSR